MYKLAIDIGTTSIKVILFSTKMNVVAKASCEYKTHFPKDGYVQQDATQWWNLTVECIKDVLKTSGVDAKEIGGIGVDGQMPTFLVLDKNGVPLYDAIIWLDNRAQEESDELHTKIGGLEKVMKITGNAMDASLPLPKLKWFEKHCPDLYAKVDKLVTSNGYINYKLTGNHSIDVPNACVIGIYDPVNKVWSDQIIKAAEISAAWLPPIYNCDDVIGRVNEQASVETGLAVGTPVIAGSPDNIAASLEAGALDGGIAFESTGTCSSLHIMFDQYINCATQATVMVGFTPDVQKCDQIGAMTSIGASYKWIGNILYSEEKRSYEEMNERINQDAPNPTSIIFFPYLTGERSPIWNPNACGVFFGFSLNTKKGHMMRAVMEGTSFALRDNIEAAKASGICVDKIRSVGGCTNSDMWLKIKASIINMPIEIPDVSLGALGGMSLMLSPLVSEYCTIQAAIDDCVKMKKVIYPVPEWVEHYDKMFGIFKSIYNNTIPNFDQLARLKS